MAPIAAIPGFASRLFLSGALAFLVAGAVPALYGVSLPVWSDRFGLGDGDGAVLLSTQGTGAFIAVLSGVFGLPGLSMKTGLAALALGTALLGLSETWGLTLAGAFVTGFGFGLLTTSVNRSFLGGFGARGPGMVGLVNAIYGLGAILSPLTFLLAGSRPELVFGTIAVLASAAMVLAVRDAVPAPRGLPDLRQPKLLVTLFILASGLIEGISVGFGASALAEVGVSQTAAARLTSGFFVAYLLSRLSLFWLTRWFGPGRLFLVGAGGAGLAMTVAALGAPVLGYVSAGLFVGMIFPSYYVWAIRILGEDPRMTAAILTMGLLGGTMAPTLIRPILAAAGEDAVFGIVATVGLTLAATFAALRRRAEALGPPSA